MQSGDLTYTPVEVELSNHFFNFLLCRTSKRRRVKVMQLVESQQFWKVGEGLVADPVDNLITLLDLVDNVVANFGILSKTLDLVKTAPASRHSTLLPNAQHEVAENGCAVSDQEHPALTLLHQQVCGF